MQQPPETVLIPAGTFTMGDDNARPDEAPAHAITLSAFRIAILPVTNADYADFRKETGHEAPRFWDDPAFTHPRQPIVGANWYDAVAYCGWLSHRHGAHYRLPTEAEWEKAALGGATPKYPWGDEPFDGEGGRFPMEATWEVGKAPPNGYGIIDIGFNVHEWCSDWYDANYYATSSAADPQGPPTGQRRSSRGGAWRHLIKVSRCSARSSIPPDYKYNDYGFRIVKSVE